MGTIGVDFDGGVTGNRRQRPGDNNAGGYLQGVGAAAGGVIADISY